MSSASHNGRHRTGACRAPTVPAHDLVALGAGIAGLNAATSAAEAGLAVLGPENTERIDGFTAAQDAVRVGCGGRESVI